MEAGKGGFPNRGKALSLLHRFNSADHRYPIPRLRVRMHTFMSPSAAKTERRRKYRKRPLTLVYVELAATNGGMMRDLSEEGFALRAMMPLRAGEKTPFSFSLNESARIEGEGEIRWTEENGRVAGIRFGEISSLARTQIHDWLSGTLASRKESESPTKLETPHAPTMEELREELRSTPPREAAQAELPPMPPLPPPESAPGAREGLAATPPIEQVPANLHVVGSTEASHVPVPEKVESPAPMPSLPPLPSVQNVSVPPDEPIPSIPPPRHGTLLPVELPEPLAQSSTPVSDELPPEADPTLPDISEILIQPHGQGKRISPYLAGPEPVSTLEHAPGAPRRSWAERFTLWHAICLMLFLTVVVAISAYHREIGKALIWLGEEMGGVEANHSSSRSSEHAVPNAPQVAVMDNSAQTSLSPVTKNALPPVTPLSGMSTLPSSDASQGTGEEEYVEAMQLLRGKNAAADTAEAVRLLWISVEKGHPSAEVALADLYWHGRGVVRNCDQTRILLSAAARKGNAEAQKRLQQFQREGCE